MHGNRTQGQPHEAVDGLQVRQVQGAGRHRHRRPRHRVAAIGHVINFECRHRGSLRGHRAGGPRTRRCHGHRGDAGRPRRARRHEGHRTRAQTDDDERDSQPLDYPGAVLGTRAGALLLRPLLTHARSRPAMPAYTGPLAHVWTSQGKPRRCFTAPPLPASACGCTLETVRSAHPHAGRCPGG